MALEDGQRLALRAPWPIGEVDEPRGCPDCNFLGYHGRVAVYELLEITPALRRLGKHWDEQEIVPLARSQGFRSMREGALEKLRDGVTGLEEVVETTLSDEDT